MIEFVQRRKWWLWGIICLGALIALFERWRSYRENSQDQFILAAAARYRVDAALVKAVVWRESYFNPNARGASGEYGLMQIMPDTGREWAQAEGVTLFLERQLFDPGKNTQAGSWYLRKQLHRYRAADNPVPYALAAYNAGPGRADRWSKGAAATNSAAFLRQIDFPGTKRYVESVLRRHQLYRKTFPPKKP